MKYLINKKILDGAKMKYDAIIIGGGVAGLTAAAYLAKSGSYHLAM